MQAFGIDERQPPRHTWNLPINEKKRGGGVIKKKIKRM